MTKEGEEMSSRGRSPSRGRSRSRSRSDSRSRRRSYDSRYSDYSDYSDSFDSGDASQTSPNKSDRKQTTVRKGAKPVGRGGKKVANSRNSKQGGPTPRPMDYVTKRMLSARRIKINELRNEVEDLNTQLHDLRSENKVLTRQQRLNNKALDKYEVQENEMPTLIQRHGEEVRALKEQLRRQKEKYSKADKKLRNTQEELEKTKRLLGKMRELVDDKKLGERDELNRKLTKAEQEIDEKDKRIKDLERHVENLQKNQKHEFGIERARHKDTQRKVTDLQDLVEKIQIQLKEKEKELEIKNIYAQRVMRAPHKLNSSVSSSPMLEPPPRHRKRSEPGLTPRENAKKYEQKRRAEEKRKHELDEYKEMILEESSFTSLPPISPITANDQNKSQKPVPRTRPRHAPKPKPPQPVAPSRRGEVLQTGQAEHLTRRKSQDLSPEGYVPTFKSKPKSPPPHKTGRRTRQRSPSPYHRSPTPVRHRSPTPIRHHSPSPVRHRSPSPVRHRSPTPVRRRRSPSPFRLRSPTPPSRILSPSPSPVLFSLDNKNKSRDKPAVRGPRGHVHRRGHSEDPFALSERERQEREKMQAQEERARREREERNRRNEETKVAKEPDFIAKMEAERTRELKNLEEKEKEEEDRQWKEDRERRKREAAVREKEVRERERREREERDEHERRKQEDIEREDQKRRIREDKERREREEQERREKEERMAQAAREEAERRAQADEASKERQRQKDLLLAKMKEIDQKKGSSNQASARIADPFSPSSGNSRKEYEFTEPVENLHQGKPSKKVKVPVLENQRRRSLLDDDDDFGGYQPSFDSKPAAKKPARTRGFFDDSPKNSASAARGNPNAKSNLMDDLFGSKENKPQNSKKSNNDEVGLFGSPASSGKGTKTGKHRESSSTALFGGGNAIIDDDEAPPRSNNHLLPRRQRQPATAIHNRPTVNAVDSLDDDLEEVVL